MAIALFYILQYFIAVHFWLHSHLTAGYIATDRAEGARIYTSDNLLELNCLNFNVFLNGVGKELEEVCTLGGREKKYHTVLDRQSYENGQFP